MPSFCKNAFLLFLSALLIGCAGGGGRAGSEIPVATTPDPLPQRQSSSNPNTSGIAASRSEPVIYDYPGATRNLNMPAPTPAPSSAVKAPASAPGALRYHTVLSGDSLWSISKKYNSSIEAIRSANGMTSDLIKPGQNLKIP